VAVDYSQKGGAGKTTLAIHLAVAAEGDGKQSAIVDLDPQASAANWGDSRKEETPVIVSAQPSWLDKVLAAAKSAGAVLAIIDTAPYSESASLAAARAADFIIVPCRPAVLDLHAISHSIDSIKLAGRPASVMLNTVPPGVAWLLMLPPLSPLMACLFVQSTLDKGQLFYMR